MRQRRSRLLRYLLLGVVLVLGAQLFFLPSGGEYIRNNPETTKIIKERTESSAVKVSDLRKQWTSFGRLPGSLKRAVVIAEDINFYSHNGFDWGELLNAFTEIFSKWRFRGASTITQQVAKNLYLSSSRNPFRKLKEAIITYRLESRLTKNRILELYLNSIEWGPGIFGISAASHYYFGKAPSALTIEESAFLASIIPAPNTTFNPKLHRSRVEKRQRLILARMARYQGGVNREPYLSPIK